MKGTPRRRLALERLPPLGPFAVGGRAVVPAWSRLHSPSVVDLSDVRCSGNGSTQRRDDDVARGARANGGGVLET